MRALGQRPATRASIFHINGWFRPWAQNLGSGLLLGECERSLGWGLACSAPERNDFTPWQWQVTHVEVCGHITYRVSRGLQTDLSVRYLGF